VRRDEAEDAAFVVAESSSLSNQRARSAPHPRHAHVAAGSCIQARLQSNHSEFSCRVIVDARFDEGLFFYMQGQD
jgi:hypothetical protein